LGGGFNRQLKKKYFASRRESSEWQLIKGEPVVGNYSRSLIFFHIASKVLFSLL
jgi:hypothetical protein